MDIDMEYQFQMEENSNDNQYSESTKFDFLDTDKTDFILTEIKLILDNRESSKKNDQYFYEQLTKAGSRFYNLNSSLIFSYLKA